MLQLIFTRKLRPMNHRLGLGVIDVGRDDGGPRATSSLTNSGVTELRDTGADDSPGCCFHDPESSLILPRWQ